MGAIVLLHISVAVIYRSALGVSILIDDERNTWDWFWQTLPIDLLRTDLLSSIWHLHAQPPLFNLYGGILAKLAYPHHLEVMHLINILLGGILSGLIYLLAKQFAPNRTVAVVWAVILALNPALFLYEAFILYSLPTAFLIVVHLSCILWHERTHSNAAIYAFMISLNALILLRSVFHIFLIPLALVLIWSVSNKRIRGRRLLLCILMSFVSIGWCAKNYAMYGFFGTSSWTGMGLWRIASADYPQNELVDRFIAGDIDRVVVERVAFSLPSEYISYGFDKQSSIPSLANDDHNNINIPAISALYGVNAVRLILVDPPRYVHSIYRGYIQFCKPSSGHLSLNAHKITYHVKFYSHYLQGAALRPSRKDISVFEFVLLPFALILYPILTLMRGAHNRWSISNTVKQDALMMWCYTIILYTTVVSCTMEYGENERFKFLVEQLIWVFLPVVFARSWIMIRLYIKLGGLPHFHSQ